MQLAHALRSLVVVGIAVLPLYAGAAIKTYSFNLDAAQEVPPNSSPAAGSAQITIDDVLGTITFYSAVFNLDGDAFAAGIHSGPAGMSGAPVFDLAAAADVATPVTIGPISVPHSLSFAGVSKPIDTTLGASINASPWLYYMNIDTTAHPDGEVRGQLSQTAPIPEPSTFWMLGAGLAVAALALRRRWSYK